MDEEYYTSVVDLPISIFSECIANGNLGVLAISGDCTREQLLTAWQGIIQEYEDSVGVYEEKLYLGANKRLNALFANYDTLVGLLKQLKATPNQLLTARINHLLSTAYLFDTTEPAKYYEELLDCSEKINGIGQYLESFAASLQPLDAKFSDPKNRPTIEYYSAMLSFLTIIYKREINDNITVYEYCDLMRGSEIYFTLLENESPKQ